MGRGGALFSSCAISMKALLQLSPYVRSGIEDFLEVKMLSRSAAVWRRNVSGVVVGKGIFWGGDSTVSTSLVPPVSGIQHLKHL